MIDNIIINKAFVPELPGEWAGGLIQVNTKDMPAKNYLNIQLGTGFNTQTIGENFYTDNAGSLEKRWAMQMRQDRCLRHTLLNLTSIYCLHLQKQQLVNN
jgi:hypothetical protein